MAKKPHHMCDELRLFIEGGIN